MITPKSYKNNNPWDDSGNPVWLLTPEELPQIPDGTVLTGIMGSTRVKGTDYIDEDTRFGYIAWGLHESQFAPEGL